MSRYMLLLIVLVAGLQAYPQNDGCLSHSVVMTVRAFSRKLADGRTILIPTDLRARVSDRDVPVESLVHSPNPLRVVVILDIGATQTKVTWDASLAMARALANEVPDDTEFSLSVFDDKARAPTSFKRGPRALDDLLASLSPTKNTESRVGLYDALNRGIDSFGGFHAGNSIFLITAWEGDRNRDRLDGLLRSLSENGARLFGVSFDQSVLPGKLPTDSYAMVSGFTALDAASTTSGGLWLRGTGVGQIAGAVKVVGTTMSDFYAIVLKLAQPITQPEKLKLDLTAEGKAHLKEKGDAADVKLFYPPELNPCR
jgi:hypothetical protein